jgi:hypothetical protein
MRLITVLRSACALLMFLDGSTPFTDPALEQAGALRWDPQRAIDSILDSRRKALDSTAALLRTRYVSEDTGLMIAQRIQRRLSGGAYTGLSDSAFRAAVTSDMQSVNGDLHLYFRAESRTAPNATDAATPFLSRVEILDGNVGLLQIDEIAAPTEATVRELRSALSKLSECSAVIIDLRNNGGGSADMNDSLWSYFVSDSLPTVPVWVRSTDRTAQRFVLPRPSPPRLTKAPLFILTSPRTGSAAEGFAFFLQEIGRATIVGTRSAGAGHIVRAYPVGGGNIADVSIARVRSSRPDENGSAPACSLTSPRLTRVR